MKIHLFSIFKYILGFVLILLFIWIFEQDYLVFLLFPYILLPAVLIPSFLLNYKKIKYRGYSNVQSAVSGASVSFYFEYDNPSWLPFSKCAFVFSLNNMYYQNKFEHILNLPILPKKKSAIEIPVETSKIGLVRLSSDKLNLSDFMGFITISIPISIKLEIPVLPHSRVEAIDLQIPASEGFDEYSEPDYRGNVSSDVKEIREYRPGDRLQRVHWKLSAKLDDLFVKEMDRTSVMSLILLPELVGPSIETTITYLDSIAHELYTRGERFEICLFNNNTCDFSYFLIDSEEAMYNCYMTLYYLPLYDTPGTARDAYFASAQKNAFIVSLCGSDVRILPENM